LGLAFLKASGVLGKAPRFKNFVYLKFGGKSVGGK
jgi:hypothetical protein